MMWLKIKLSLQSEKSKYKIFPFKNGPLFFFIDFAVLTFEMTATNLKAYSRPPEDHTSTALNGYFPCGLLVFYHLVSTAQKQLSACRRFKKKNAFYPHTPRGY